MIDANPNHLATVKGILARHVPDCEVRAFGSRVTWTAKEYSDLDLAVVGSSALPPQTLSRLRESLEKFNLPFRVDLLDWHAITPAFRNVIEKKFEVIQEGKKGTIGLASEWQEAQLGDLVDFVSGGTPSTGNSDYWNGSMPWVSAKDMKRLFLDDTEDHVTEEGLKNGTRLAPANTVMLLTRGMTLLNDVPICVARRPMTFNQDVKALRPKGRVEAKFLPYLLLGNKQRLLSLVDLAGHGTGRLNTYELESLDVLLPPNNEQLAIAHVLGTLDEKIELNRRMSESLETAARALFKSWFVDFEPSRAKAEGRDTGLSKSLRDLFPDSFVDSEIGEIPKGWRASMELGCPAPLRVPVGTPEGR